MSQTPFTVGDRVKLSRVLRPLFLGCTGTVERVIKSRKVVRVRLDLSPVISQTTYEADPANLDHIAEVAP